MTNEEAIKELKADMSFLELEDYCEADMEEFEIAINSIQENTKLKAEIEELRGKYNNLILSSEIHVADRKLIGENESLKAEIEQLKADLEQSVKLPCKVGDIVYTTNWMKTKVFTHIVTGFQVHEEEVYIMTYEGQRISNKNIGEHLFVTEKQAVESLKGKV